MPTSPGEVITDSGWNWTAAIGSVLCSIAMITLSSVSAVTDSTGQYRPPTPDELAAFRDALVALSVPVVRRYSGGNEIGGGCGTLAASRAGGVEIEQMFAAICICVAMAAKVKMRSTPSCLA